MIERSPSFLQGLERSERLPPELLTRLLDFAHQRFGGDNPESDYLYFFGEENKFSIPLPTDFSALVLGDSPERFKITAYQQDQRGRPVGRVFEPWSPNYRCVVLATSDSRRAKSALSSFKGLKYETNDEETLLELIKSFNGGHIRRLNVVNGKITDFPPSTFSRPQGSSEAQYSLDEDGKLNLVYEDIQMVGDFNVFTSTGPVGGRWKRILMTRVESSDQGESDLFPNVWYTDEYLLQGLRKVRARVTVKIWGDIETPQKVVVKIGTGPGIHNGVPRTFLNNGLKVIVTKEGETQLDFTRTDPNFRFLFETGNFDRVSLSDVQRFIKNRITQLHNDWTKERDYVSGKTSYISREYPILTSTK